MDTNVAGLNKVRCSYLDSLFDGKTVTITDGINTWMEVLENAECTFLIPSMPAPAKRTYTVTLHNGDETAAALYTRDIELGFGDSIDIILNAYGEPVTKGTVPIANTSRVGGIKASTASYTDRGYDIENDGVLTMKVAGINTLGCVKVGNNMSIGSNGLINPANIEYGTSSKTSGSSSLTTGRIYCQYE